MERLIICDILIPSLKRLYKMDFSNIKDGVSERNICARLALHIENNMRDYDNSHVNQKFQHYYADVEYNRMGDGSLKRYENRHHRPRYMVSDLLIQSRGPMRNLLAVELKRKGNKKNVYSDKERLASLVSSISPASPNTCVHDTLVGAFIVYSPNEIEIDIFKNIDGIGRQTDRIILKYDQLVQ